MSTVIILLSTLQCKPAVEPGIISGRNISSKEKVIRQKGVHVFGRLDSTSIRPLIHNNFNWVTIVPYGNQKDHKSPEVYSRNRDSTRLAERNARIIEWINTAHAAGMKVFVKPHIWIFESPDDKWRSDIYPTSEENWQLWQKSYREFIFRYAHLAEEADAEMFCVGAELTKLTLEKPEFWKKLIEDVRKIYSGKITYAANWYKEYENITFWGDLDYIGIQAYFPLVKNENPSIKQISKGWKKHLASIESIHRKFNLPIVFTELGYKSTADSGMRPWEWIDYENTSEEKLSLETQANCYQAFFDTVWEKEWMAGFHLWQWRSNPSRRRGNKRHLDFTPQEKPAAEIIKEALEKDF